MLPLLAVFNNVHFVAHWCDFQNQVAPWNIFVHLCKAIKRPKLGKIYRKNLKIEKEIAKFDIFKKIYAWKCNKKFLGGQKYGAVWGKTKCAPLCALFGQIRCAFEFRIINHSELWLELRAINNNWTRNKLNTSINYAINWTDANGIIPPASRIF